MNNQQREKLSKLFTFFKPNQFIYPGVLIRNLNIEMRQAYVILDWITEAGFLQKNYEIYCPNESKATGKIYDNILDLLGDDPNISCPDCNSDINLIANNILIYKVLKEVTIEYER